ncbi:hypothetical protein ONS95_010360 [Cadophora gregata]|uniref:uncharacterized protein n=1 Tax=Cadophora gregata TaxID=51156 RepID=UPI0026DB4E02|nr:uncharacterized protein ONS95_010360 [Cadophora gregata]KAK0122098.1 hypothetical protein ONS95_010360 [Cadophora gregata]KAK0127572.1 hypothetical protein ONS96_007103 [Cadophora gregata f. sp. sojae]
MISFAVLSGALSITNGTLSLGRFALKFKDVDSDTRTCVLLLKRVNKDIAAAEELCKLLDSKKIWRSTQFKRVVDIISDTRQASLELPKLIQVSKMKPLTVKNRIRWVMMDKESFLNRERRLNYCHQSLLQIIGTMEHALFTWNPPSSTDITSAKNHSRWQEPSQKIFHQGE